ncbi:MAG: hypothetical protein KBH06_00895 [Spirochaetes bacterium]|nr:hypothetical protein [Spirochaetota bacterium]
MYKLGPIRKGIYVLKVFSAHIKPNHKTEIIAVIKYIKRNKLKADKSCIFFYYYRKKLHPIMILLESKRTLPEDVITL